MIYYNDILKETDWVSYILNFILPEYYGAVTIDDFLNNKSEIKPTKKILPFGVLFYNRALVRFPTVSYKNKDDKTGFISDASSSIEVRLGFLIDSKKEKLENGMVLYKPHIIYKPKDDSKLLMDYETHGPLSRSREKSLKFEFGKLEFSPA